MAKKIKVEEKEEVVVKEEETAAPAPEQFDPSLPENKQRHLR